MSLTGKLICLLLLAFMSSGALARELLVVVPATSSPLISEFTDALRLAQPDDLIRVSNAPPPDANSADTIIVLGSEMLQWRLQSALNTPTIALYLNHQALPDEPLPDYLHTLLANPKPIRQLRLAQRLLPRLRTAGLLYPEGQSGLAREWAVAIADSGLQQQSQVVGPTDNLTRPLLKVLDQSDVLIGNDAPAIYNADNLKTILLTSYSRNKVLIGPSAPFIEAGSLSTTYSTAQDMARSVALLLQSDNLQSGLSYPAYFSVLSNAQVARSLGLPVPDDAKLGRELAELEQTP